MDVDELDELVDFEEDAMMTDAVEDAGGEIDMDPVEEENQDDDAEMSGQADIVPEGTTDSVAMTPMPFINTTDEMQDEPSMDGTVPDPTPAEWPPAPTSIPAVPSRLPEASLVPPGIQHEEGQVLLSEVNSIVAEPPASPSKTVASFALPGMSRPPSPPIVVEGLRDVTSIIAEEGARAATIAAQVTPSVAEVIETTSLATDAAAAVAAVEATVSDAQVEQDKAGVLTGSEAGAVARNGTGSEDAAGEAKAPVDVNTTTEVPPAENEIPGAVTKSVGNNDEVDEDQDHDEIAPTEEADYDEANYADDHDELSEEDEVEQDEETGEPKFSPIVIEIVTNALRPLFFPLSEANAMATERLTRSDHDDWETEPYYPLLPGRADKLYKAPLRKVFKALRTALREDWDESRGTEMILHERTLGLKIGEDNKHTETLSLHDLVDLYTRCNCPEPMVLSVEYESVRFIAKYNAIKKVLDSSAAPPDVDESIDGEDSGAVEGDDHDEGEDHDYDGLADGASFGAVDGDDDVEEDRENAVTTSGFPEEEPGHPEDAEAVASEPGLPKKELPDSHDALQEPVAPTSSATASDLPVKADSKSVEDAEPETRETMTSIPLPEANDKTVLETVSNDLPVSGVGEDELEDGDEEDIPTEDNDGDKYGIDAAVRQTEREAELADAHEETVDVQPASDKDASEAKSPGENGLKRGLDTEELAASERSVKRKLSAEPVAE